MSTYYNEVYIVFNSVIYDCFRRFAFQNDAGDGDAFGSEILLDLRQVVPAVYQEFVRTFFSALVKPRGNRPAGDFGRIRQPSGQVRFGPG